MRYFFSSKHNVPDPVCTLDFLGGHLPEGKDLNDVKGILASAEMLRQKCKDTAVPTEGALDF